MAKKLKSTLLVPTLNEIEAIQVVMPQIEPGWVDEIIVIDGGSTDGTVEWFKEHGYTVHSQTGRGFGAGMREGMQLAKGEIVVEFTPDGNSIPDVIPKLVAKVAEGYDLVIASRYKDDARSEDDDFVTAFGNWMFTTMVNILFRARYTDVLVGFRAYRKSVALTLGMDAPGLSWPCDSSICFAKYGHRTAEIAADEPDRIGGVRKMRPIKTGWEILKLIMSRFFSGRRKNEVAARSG
jgi:glycosyltransferase involved in cell wall biosynthesis